MNTAAHRADALRSAEQRLVRSRARWARQIRLQQLASTSPLERLGTHCASGWLGHVQMVQVVPALQALLPWLSLAWRLWRQLRHPPRSTQ